MANYVIGDVIHEVRVKKNYSQEELCFGICSLSSLSRIENNLQFPSKRIIDALFEKLAISDMAFNVCISKDDMKIFLISHKIMRKLSALEFEDLDVLVQEFESYINDNNAMDQQYLLFTKTMIERNQGKSKEYILDKLIDILKMTMPDFESDNLKERRLITFVEISIINNIGTLYYDLGNRQIGLRILFWLAEYMENNIIDDEEKSKKYPMVLYNISKRIGEMGRLEDAYKMAQKGIDMCIEYGKLHPLPYLMVNKGCAAAELGAKDEATQLFNQAFVLFQICQKEHILSKLKSEVCKRYNLKL